MNNINQYTVHLLEIELVIFGNEVSLRNNKIMYKSSQFTSDYRFRTVNVIILDDFKF